MDTFMSMTIGEIIKSSAWFIAALAVCFEITPIKFNPVSLILGWLGKKLNGDVLNQIGTLKEEIKSMDGRVEEVNKRVDDTQKSICDLSGIQDERYAIQCRARILRGGEEIRIDPVRSIEYYSQVLEDIDVYENFCNGHPEFPNNKSVATIALIKEKYHECLVNNSFLV